MFLMLKTWKKYIILPPSTFVYKARTVVLTNFLAKNLQGGMVWLEVIDISVSYIILLIGLGEIIIFSYVYGESLVQVSVCFWATCILERSDYIYYSYRVG